jgi:hypothetical protein
MSISLVRQVLMILNSTVGPSAIFFLQRKQVKRVALGQAVCFSLLSC